MPWGSITVTIIGRRNTHQNRPHVLRSAIAYAAAAQCHIAELHTFGNTAPRQAGLSKVLPVAHECMHAFKRLMNS
jgi:hypothetical protein